MLVRSAPAKWILIGAGFVCVGLGAIGVVLPLLPTTPFLLLAVWSASRGSQRLHDWIYDQPRFAKLLNDWHQQGAVPVSAKLLASAMMIVSLGFLAWSGYHWGFLLGMSLMFLLLGTFLWTRPNPQP